MHAGTKQQQTARVSLECLEDVVHFFHNKPTFCGEPHLGLFTPSRDLGGALVGAVWVVFTSVMFVVYVLCQT